MTNIHPSPSSTPASVFAENLLRGLLGLIAGLYLAGVIALMCGIRISSVTATGGIALGFLLPFLIPPGTRGWRVPLAIAAFTLLALIPSGWFIDLSWDGIAYHKPAVIQFLDGWNPYRDGSSQQGVDVWSAVYPKASWIIGAQVVALTGWLEHGKVLNFLALAAAVLAVWRFLNARFPSQPKVAVVGSLLIGCNPVAVYQAPTYYIDGLLGSLLTVLLFSLAHHLSQPTSRRAWFEIAASVLILVNLKFTGLVYTGAAFAVAGGICIFRQPFRTTLSFAGLGGIVLAVAVLVCGKTPYTDNLLSGRHLFYPLLGENSADIITAIRPANLAEHDRVTSFLIANFSVSESVRAPASTRPRLPLDIRGISRQWCDIEAGGFGPLFAEAILLASGIGIFFLIRRKSPFGIPGLFLVIAILLTGFCHREAWWARYSPQLFMLPGLSFLAISSLPSRWSRAVGASGFALLALNLLVIVYFSSTSKRKNTLSWHESVAEMRKEIAVPGAAVELDLGTRQALKRQLIQSGIPCAVITNSDPAKRKPLAGMADCFWQTGVNLQHSPATR